MKRLTRLQYEVILLYSKGLTFKEIDSLLKTPSRGVYSQVLLKDKGRITRAKISREKNIKRYKINLHEAMIQIKEHNKLFDRSAAWVRVKNTIPLDKAKIVYRSNYLTQSLEKAHKSYTRYKITYLKNRTQKVA